MIGHGHRARLRSRYRFLTLFFLQLTLSLGFWEMLLPAVGLRGLARRTRGARLRRIAAEFRVMAVRMGGVMIKVGQFLSARLDVLPAELTDELAGLQDEVPAEDFSAIRALAESELGGPLESVFASFDPQPMAAASLGQVHRARLVSDAPEAPGFRDVVVKIQRPGIGDLINVDFAALHTFGTWIQHYRPLRRRVDIVALIQELSDTVHREIDYKAEGSNAEAFAANFASRKHIRVPRVVWSRTTERVLTLENVYAIKITDYGAISGAGVDRRDVARVLFETYLKQVFEDHFFHADPHPGNLFVSPATVAGGRKRKVSWKLTFVDFGMVGTVPPDLRRGMRDMVVGVGTRNAPKVVQAYQTLGVLLPGANLDLLTRAEAQLFDRLWGMSMQELRSVPHSEMRQFAMQFREILYSMPFQLPHNLLLLGRTISILSGMCTGLDPDFNPWRQIAPYAQKMLTEEGVSNWPAWLDEAGELVRTLLSLPSQTARVLTRLERGELLMDMPRVGRQIYHLEGAVNRVAGAIVLAALLSSGVLMYRSGATSLAIVFWGMSGIALVWVLLFSRGHPPRP
jgi:predicted unusual protein kinase regulating ubiquinone biosynthesis (AarF/ABC1/UbiB family)